MKKISETMVFILAVLLAAHPALAGMSSSAQLIPTGKVSVVSGGKESKPFQAEIPLPEGVMLLCNGSCLVQAPSVQLVAQDRAVFGLTEARESWDLTIKSGRVDFALRADAKPVVLQTPRGLLRIEKLIVPASTAGLVRGSILVTEQTTAITAEEGTFQVASAEGTQVVQPGHQIELAQSVLPSSTTPPVVTGPAAATGPGLTEIVTTAAVFTGTMGGLATGFAVSTESNNQQTLNSPY